MTDIIKNIDIVDFLLYGSIVMVILFFILSIINLILILITKIFTYKDGSAFGEIMNGIILIIVTLFGLGFCSIFLNEKTKNTLEFLFGRFF